MSLRAKKILQLATTVDSIENNVVDDGNISEDSSNKYIRSSDVLNSNLETGK